MSADLTGQPLGHYLVQEVIGRGGMSVVYRGFDQRLQRSVALKVMSKQLSADPEFRTRFLEEARAASAIDHVNVVPLYDFGEAAGALFIAMRLVDGTDLARELAAGPLPVRRALALLGQVGAALDMLHDRGLVHLDVKPANVLITRNESVGTEHVYLADFGLTRRGAGGHRTAAGDFLGSPSYASPEHLRGGAIGPASDQYSMTCMVFAALAGRPPYIGDVRTVVTGHLSGVVPSLAALTDVPTAIDRVVARGLAVDPAARYPSVSDLLTAVRRAISDDEAAGPATARLTPDPETAAHSSAGIPDRSRRPAAGGGPAAAAGTAGRANPVPPSALSARPGAPRSGSDVAGEDVGQAGAHAGSRGPGGGWAAAPQTVTTAPGVTAASPTQHPGLRSAPHSPGQPQVRPPGAGAGPHRPAHRIEPVRSRWPWLVGTALVVVLAVVLVLVITGATDTSSWQPLGRVPSGISDDAATVGTASR